MAKSVDLRPVLDQFRAGDLKRFKSYLCENLLEGYKPIPIGQLENSDVTDVVEKMKQFYPGEESVKITMHILEKMNRNDLVGEIKRQMETPTVDQQRYSKQPDLIADTLTEHIFANPADALHGACFRKPC